MHLTERHIIKPSHPLWLQFDQLCSLSKNLYNAALYDVRQYYFENRKHKTWMTQRPQFVAANNPDYRALPAKVSGEVLQQVGRNFTSFFNALKSKLAGTNDRRVEIPGYLPKDGRNVVTFPRDAISVKSRLVGEGLFEHVLCRKDLNIKILTRHERINIVRIIPQRSHYVLEVVYTPEKVELKPDNGRYAGIDLGVSNLVTLVGNTFSPLLVGRHVKSINQFYNKRVASMQSKLPKGVSTSKRIRSFTDKRNRKIMHELHNISSMVVNHLVSREVNTLIIGYNLNWKQDPNMGRRNNQTFKHIPHRKLVSLLEYKCALKGIKVILTEESYTSKCSFLDLEVVSKREVYAGRRVKRGMFKSSTGRIVNADVNGAYNIMRKVVPDSVLFQEGIEGVAVHPRKVKLLTNGA